MDAAIYGGVGLVQLREKDLPAAELYSLGLRLKDVIGGRALLFVNDRIDVALAVEADGVQLGEQALPLDAANRVSASRLLLGRSVHSVAGALEAETRGADMLTLGTIFPTASHPGVRTGGLGLVKSVADAVSAPFIAIGGIDASNVGCVVESGACGAAVITAITMADDPGAEASALLAGMRSVSEPAAAHML